MWFFNKNKTENSQFVSPEADFIRNENETGVFFWEFIKIILIALVIVIPLRYFVVQPFVVNGESMETNFSDKDYLIVDEMSYKIREPKRGEVVVFRYKGNQSEYFIKRIIGMPGERVEVSGGKVTIFNGNNSEGKNLVENAYLENSKKTPGEARITLGPDEYFVMGDNRNASSDSRTWGSLDKKDIVGKAWLRLLPLEKVGFIEDVTHSYNLSGFIHRSAIYLASITNNSK